MAIASSRRVLIVDNDPHFRDSVQVLLDAKGYVVFAAGTRFEARQIAQREKVHVAVLDIRMEDDPDHDDVSGLVLAGQLDPLIVKIMLTGYPSVETVRSSFGDVSAFDFVAKAECPAGLLDALSRAFAEEVRINFDLLIRWQGIRLEQIAREIKLEDKPTPAVVAAEVEEALGKLFQGAEEILVDPLIPTSQMRSVAQSGAVLLKVGPRYRGSRWGAPVVVKLATRDKIDAEARNYRQYVERFIAGFRHTSLHDIAQTHLLGGIVYTLVGTPLEECVDLGTFYAGHSAREVVEALKGLFTETCRHWYANREARQTHDLVALYSGPLKLSVERLEAALQEGGLSDLIGEGRLRHRVRGLRQPIINPIEWLRQHPELLTRTSLCYTHGDLRSQNVLVDNNRHAWLIDFHRAGPGHFFRDLIELESDVKFVLLDVTDLPSLARFETALLGASDFDDMLTLPDFRQPELKKAFSVVQGIRNIAGKLTGLDADMLDYYRGLLLQTLTMIRLRNVHPLKKRHAYLAASLLCERLDEW
jgi:ActR/RegA family two-component response regulator